MPESKRRKPKRTTRTMPKTAGAEAKAKGPSPTWYVWLMAGLLGLGLLAVLARFIFQWPQYFLFGGFLMIAAGFIMATNYR
ncbi:MAG: cell division protein CrgA [Acidimicrobiia bacterium]